MGKRYIGDKAFYRSVFAIAIPMIIQNGINNFVSLLDNIMVGQLGTAQMSGVSVVNQFVFIFTLTLVGATSGAGIFTAQFFGSRDHQSIRYTFRFKVIACLVIGVLGIGILLLGGIPLISTFLQGEGEPEQIRATLQYGLDYASVIVWGMLPMGLFFAYSTTLRECGESKVPMIAGTAAVFVNLFLNYVLIFGHFGLPAMGVKGAALATVIARYVELLVALVWTHLNGKKHPFIQGALRSAYIPAQLLGRISLKGTPLLFNEFLWAFGLTFLNQCYSTRSLDVVSATNICTTISNLANVVTMALGVTIGIVMGQMMGSGRPEQEIRDANRKLVALCVFMGVIFGALLALIAVPFPRFYNAEPRIHALATKLILIIAIMKPTDTYMYSGYYTLRAGGKTWLTFLYDGGYVWLVTVPVVYVLSRFTDIDIVPLYAISFSTNLIKCVVGYFLIRKGNWIQNLTR